MVNNDHGSTSRRQLLRFLQSAAPGALAVHSFTLVATGKKTVRIVNSTLRVRTGVVEMDKAVKLLADCANSARTIPSYALCRHRAPRQRQVRQQSRRRPLPLHCCDIVLFDSKTKFESAQVAQLLAANCQRE